MKPQQFCASLATMVNKSGLAIAAVAVFLCIAVTVGRTWPSIDQDFGTFGAWNVSRGTAPNGMPLCDMMQINDRKEDPSITFLLTAALPKTVNVLILRPFGGLGGVSIGQEFLSRQSTTEQKAGAIIS
jgi:hypothetical protein